MLTKFIMGIILQYVHIPNRHVIHLVQYSYINYISVKLGGGDKEKGKICKYLEDKGISATISPDEITLEKCINAFSQNLPSFIGIRHTFMKIKFKTLYRNLLTVVLHEAVIS